MNRTNDRAAEALGIVLATPEDAFSYLFRGAVSFCMPFFAWVLVAVILRIPMSFVTHPLILHLNFLLGVLSELFYIWASVDMAKSGWSVEAATFYPVRYLAECIAYLYGSILCIGLLGKVVYWICLTAFNPSTKESKESNEAVYLDNQDEKMVYTRFEDHDLACWRR